MGEDLRLRQRDGDGVTADGDLCRLQIHAGLDGAVIGEDEGLGGEGDLHAVKVVAVLELGHVGVGVCNGGQLPDLRQLVLQHHGIDLRGAGLPGGPAAPQKADAAHQGAQQNAQPQRAGGLQWVQGFFYSAHGPPFRGRCRLCRAACGHGARTSGEGAGADVFPVDPIVPCSAEKARAIPVQTGKTGRAAASAAALRMEKLPACREIPQRRLTGRRD